MLFECCSIFFHFYSYSDSGRASSSYWWIPSRQHLQAATEEDNLVPTTVALLNGDLSRYQCPACMDQTVNWRLQEHWNWTTLWMYCLIISLKLLTNRRFKMDTDKVFDSLTEPRGKKRELLTLFPADGPSRKHSVLWARRGSALRKTFLTSVHVVAHLVTAKAEGDESSPSAISNTPPPSRFKMR